MERMRQLVDYLNDMAYRYYTLDDPSISDAEYDKLYDELVKLEAETGERLPDSPTRRACTRTSSTAITSSSRRWRS